MVDTKYKIAYSEILEILKYVSKEDLNKIPKNMLDMFKSNASIKNDFSYNPDKTLQEQNVSETARTIIAILFRDYWATSEQKVKIVYVQNNERERIKHEKYNSDNLFNKSQISENYEENMPTENVAIIEYKESLFKKIINKIKGLFQKIK